MKIEFVEPFSRAWGRMKAALFKPFNLNKWFALGFCAFLADLIEGHGGSNNPEARFGDGDFILGWLESWGEEEIIPRTRGLGALAFVPGDVAMEVLLEAAASESPRIRGTALGGLARRWRVEREDVRKHDSYFQAFAFIP